MSDSKDKRASVRVSSEEFKDTIAIKRFVENALARREALMGFDILFWHDYECDEAQLTLNGIPSGSPKGMVVEVDVYIFKGFSNGRLIRFIYTLIERLGEFYGNDVKMVSIHTLGVDKRFNKFLQTAFPDQKVAGLF